jgi:hypothetical protein
MDSQLKGKLKRNKIPLNQGKDEISEAGTGETPGAIAYIVDTPKEANNTKKKMDDYNKQFMNA